MKWQKKRGNKSYLHSSRLKEEEEVENIFVLRENLIWSWCKLSERSVDINKKIKLLIRMVFPKKLRINKYFEIFKHYSFSLRLHKHTIKKKDNLKMQA